MAVVRASSRATFPSRRAFAAWLVANASEVTVVEVRPRYPVGVRVRYVGTARPAAKGLAARLSGKRVAVTRSRRGFATRRRR